MAMKYISPLISDGRNKLGATVWSRNRSGLYQRAYKKPTNPQTTSQQAHRAQYSSIVALWKTLTLDQYKGWNQGALTVLLTDSLGQKSHPSGYQLFLRCNLNLLYTLNITITDFTPRTINPFSGTLGPTVAAAAGGVLTSLITTNTTDDTVGNWQVAAQSTGPLGPGINFVPPQFYRNWLPIPLNAIGVDLADQWNYYRNLPVVTGQKLGLRWRVSDGISGLPLVDYSELVTIG